MKLRVRNIERFPAMGGAPSEHDRGVVIDHDRTEPNPLNGKPQHVIVKWGTLAECWEYVRSHKG